MRILIGRMGHESNTLSMERGDFERWTRFGWYEGQAMIEYAEGKTDYTSGMIKAGREHGVELAPSIFLWEAGPLILQETFESVLERLLSYIRAEKDNIDGICLALHGAGCAEETDDIETYTLKAVREIVGDEMPITITLDLHANLKESMASLAQGIFCIKQYPHIDTDEAGYKAMTALIRRIKGEHKGLYSSIRALPILIVPAVGYTMAEPMQSFAAYIRDYAREKGLVDAALAHGFCYSNRYDSGASIITVSSVSQEEADRTADELAAYVWAKRDLLQRHTPTASEAMDEAEAILAQHSDGYVAINEISDNPGGGSPCDSTYLLREMLRRNHPGSILGYIADKEMALKAHAAGVGGHISGLLGGKTDNLHGEPIMIEDAVVCALSDGQVCYNNYMVWRQRNNYGKSARIRVGNVEIVVTEIMSQQTFDNVTFSMVGADIDQYRYVGVKSAVHFHAYFDKHAIACICADSPGINTCHLEDLNLDKIRRPIYPLDEM